MSRGTFRNLHEIPTFAIAVMRCLAERIREHHRTSRGAVVCYRGYCGRPKVGLLART
jgi:hypothetical protein